MIKHSFLVSLAFQGLLCAATSPQPRPQEQASMTRRDVCERVIDAVNNGLLHLFDTKNDRNQANEFKNVIRNEVECSSLYETRNSKRYYYPSDVRKRIINNIMSFVTQKTEQYAWERTRDKSIIEAIVMDVQEHMRVLLNRHPGFDENLKRDMKNLVRGKTLRTVVHKLVDNRTGSQYQPTQPQDDRSSLYSCGICLEDYSSQVPRAVLTCGDGLCFTCAEKTFLKCSGHSSCGHCSKLCPLCRQKINVEQLERDLKPPSYASVWR